MPAKKKPKRWIAKVTTDSTHPPKCLFTKDAVTDCQKLASKKVSPKGPGSGMRILTYFINRAGHGLSAQLTASVANPTAAGFYGLNISGSDSTGTQKVPVILDIPQWTSPWRSK